MSDDACVRSGEKRDKRGGLILQPYAEVKKVRFELKTRGYMYKKHTPHTLYMYCMYVCMYVCMYEYVYVFVCCLM